MITNHRRNLGHVGKVRTAPDFPDLSPTIQGDRGCLRFPVFSTLGRSRNSEIPDRLGFSRHTENQAYQSQQSCVITFSIRERTQNPIAHPDDVRKLLPPETYLFSRERCGFDTHFHRQCYKTITRFMLLAVFYGVIIYLVRFREHERS